MTKKATLIILLLVIFYGANAGEVRLNNAFYSSLLGDSVKYAIYIPEKYDNTDKNYPVLYLLHGLGDDHTAWAKRGDIENIVNREIISGNSDELIIVMPDAKDHWYVNSFDSKVMYEDMFIKELIPYIDTEYKTIRNKDFRAVAGLSMGGHGALLYAIKYPELFAVCGALSAAVYTDYDFEHNIATFPKLMRRIFGPEAINHHWRRNNVLNLIDGSNSDKISEVRYWIDCGDDDFLYRGNSQLHIIMRDKKITHEYRVRDGGHSWKYWQTGVVDILFYLKQTFNHHKNKL